jgi:two-component system, LuxR family, sensor kinase FixL
MRKRNSTKNGEMVATRKDSKKRKTRYPRSLADVPRRIRDRDDELAATNIKLIAEMTHRKTLQVEILEVVDQEQRRLGRELHDGLCQHLTAIAFMTRAIAERIRQGKTVLPDELDKVCELIHAGVAEARTIARGLHPAEVNAAGLVDALKTLCGDKQWGVRCRVETEGEIYLVDDDMAALHLYRIAREAIINASKHAGASEIVVRLESAPRHSILTVSDDGVGLASDVKNSKGMGFHIMAYRARSMGARLQIKRMKPRGTCVTCSLPRK